MATKIQLGLVGLGKMGFNMRERIRAAGHEVVGYDRNPDVSDATSLADLVDRAGRAADRVGHGAVGRPDPADDQGAGGAARPPATS